MVFRPMFFVCFERSTMFLKMMVRINLSLVLFFFAMGVVSSAQAETTLEASIHELQHQWAVSRYQKPVSRRAENFAPLIEKAQRLADRFKGRAEPLIWQAILLVSYADAIENLESLSKVEEARDLLLRAIEIDETALGGFGSVMIGILYDRAPAWPLSIGDNDKARAYLEKGLAINPDDIDANYFYGRFLRDEGEYEQALLCLEKALRSPARPDQPVADAGRRKDIREALAKTREKLAGL
jgi:tetratricopeptide (TPR) repeat protein